MTSSVQGPCWAATNHGATALASLRFPLLVGSRTAAYFLISEIEQEP